MDECPALRRITHLCARQQCFEGNAIEALDAEVVKVDDAQSHFHQSNRKEHGAYDQ
jgi:hypothetical protein